MAMKRRKIIKLNGVESSMRENDFGVLQGATINKTAEIIK